MSQKKSAYMLEIHRRSIHFGGHVPPQKFTSFTWGKNFLEFSIGQAKNSNSSNGGAPPKILAITLCPPKISGHGPPMARILLNIIWRSTSRRSIARMLAMSDKCCMFDYSSISWEINIALLIEVARNIWFCCDTISITTINAHVYARNNFVFILAIRRAARICFKGGVTMSVPWEKKLGGPNEKGPKFGSGGHSAKMY